MRNGGCVLVRGLDCRVEQQAAVLTGDNMDEVMSSSVFGINTCCASGHGGHMTGFNYSRRPLLPVNRFRVGQPEWVSGAGYCGHGHKVMISLPAHHPCP